jgi:hypothetical protein
MRVPGEGSGGRPTLDIVEYAADLGKGSPAEPAAARRAGTRKEHTINPAAPRRALRAVLPLVALAAVAILAAPAYADPPPSGDGGDSGNRVAGAAGVAGGIDVTRSAWRCQSSVLSFCRL